MASAPSQRVQPSVLARIAAGLAVVCGGSAIAQDVPVEKYTLPNGMTVILHEDHTLPVATVNLWYRVGAKDEPEGRSGFAHLFEHLMFMGTTRVPGGEFDTIMETGGGSNNASTSLDRTNYFSTGPASLLPTLLWLDADRLEDLGRTMDQDKLEKQRAVVLNERRQTTENEPYGQAEIRVMELLFPTGHPYHHSVIGPEYQIKGATVIDVKDFFATFYVPDNCSIVVAGDFKKAEIKPVVDGLFGSLPRGGEPTRRVVQPVRLDRVVRSTMLDKVQLPKLVLAYHSPPAFKEGDAEMQLAGSVLSEGKTSRLYKRLVFDDKIASSVRAYQDGATLQSVFRVDVLANPGVDLETVERAVDEEVARLLKDGPTADELEQRRATIELGMLSRLESLQAKADALNEYQFFYGEPNSFKRDLERFRAVTPASLKAWAAKVLTRDARVVIHVLPEERGADASAKSPRDERPRDMAAAAFTFPPPERFTLANGLPVLLWKRAELPLVAVSLIVKPEAGDAFDPRGKAGLTTLTMSMLDEGAGELDALKFGDALRTLGADLSAGAAHESASVSLLVLKRNFEKAAALMADAVRRPRLEASDFDRVKRLHLEGLKEQDDQPPLVASRVGVRALLGDSNAYGWPAGGTAKTVTPITLADVKAHLAAALRPGAATILVAGDLTVDDAKRVLDHALGDWKPAASSSITAAPSSPGHDRFALPATGDATGGLRVFLVDRPEAVQTVIRYVMPGVRYADPSRVRRELLNTLLGGSFTSRLNQNLREAHGYTYGAGSRYAMQPSMGYFVMSSSVKADTTGAALKEFIAEIARLQTGDVSEEELGKARETLRTDAIQSVAGLRGVLAVAGEYIETGLPLDTLTTDLEAAKAVKVSEINAMSREAIPVERGVLVLVGDKRLILEQTKDLGLPTPTELDIYGDPVKPVPGN